MQNKQQSSVGGFVHLLTSVAARQVKASQVAQSLTCLDQASLELLEKKWSWKKLSESSDVAWSAELIEHFKDKWKWEELSCNESLPWTVELIERYKDRWEWFGLSRNDSLPWAVELLEQYDDRWNWNGLSRKAERFNY